MKIEDVVLVGLLGAVVYFALQKQAPAATPPPTAQPTLPPADFGLNSVFANDPTWGGG